MDGLRIRNCCIVQVKLVKRNGAISCKESGSGLHSDEGQSAEYFIFWSRKTVEQGVALSLLLLQNTGMIILMRLSRLRASAGGMMYDIRS